LEGAKKIFKKLLASDKNDLRALEGISYIFLSARIMKIL
jgi:hypothetical protein